jgi:hypothetical protein
MSVCTAKMGDYSTYVSCRVAECDAAPGRENYSANGTGTVLYVEKIKLYRCNIFRVRTRSVSQTIVFRYREIGSRLVRNVETIFFYPVLIFVR